MEPKDPTCFTCGLPAGALPRLNRLENGATCPTCRDRLLELLPPLFPGGEPARAGSGVEPGVIAEATAEPAVGPRALAPVRPRKGKRPRA